MSFQLDSNQIRVLSTWMYRKVGDGAYSPKHAINMQCGIDSLFIALDSKSGLKFFYNEKHGRAAFYWQRILAALGVAPKAWNIGEVYLYGKTVVYYVTERAKVLREFDDSDLGAYNQLCGLIRRVRTKLSKHTLLCDADSSTHTGNYGILNGRCVLIDMGYIGYMNESTGYGTTFNDMGDDEDSDE